MSAQPSYCSHCGAANAAENTHCVACHQSLSGETIQDTLLHERYRLLTQVGAGGFGGVYRALDMAENSRIVAIKQINLHGLSTREMIEATDGFHREVRLLSNLHHPNLPTILDTFTDPEHWYLVMEFIEGETLEEYLKLQPRSALPLKETLALGIQICTVLDFLHTREPAIIFRDLKPSNVMRAASGHIYLIDFGIARHFTPGKPTDTIPFGSPGYAAPEQYGRAQTTPRADLYSLGALLHYLLTGHDPAESPFRFAPLPLADDRELAELDSLIQRMVATEPAERPASAAEVKTTLQRLAERLRRRELSAVLADVQPVRPAPVPVFPSPAGITRRGLLKGVGTLAGVAAGVGITVALCDGVAQLSYGYRGVHGSVPYYPPSPGTTLSQYVYRGHTGAITALSWSPDGQYVASGSADKTVQVWRAADGVLVYTLSGYDEPVTSITWATDRTNVIASSGMSDGTVQVWDALIDHRDLIYHGEGRILALDWQAHTPWVVSGGTDSEIYTWSANTGTRGTSYSGHKGDVRTVTWLAPQQSTLGYINTTLDSATPTPPPTPTPSVAPAPDAVIPGSQVVSGGADGTVQIWDATTGAHVFTYTGHQAGVNGVALVYDTSTSHNLVRIVSVSDDGTVQAWYPDSAGVSHADIYSGHRGKVNAVAALSPTRPHNDLFVASAGEDQSVRIWSIFQRKPLNTYREHHAPVRAIAASPGYTDSRIVSGDADGLVHLWTVSTFSDH